MGFMKDWKDAMEKQKAEDAKKDPKQLRKENIFTGIILLVLIFGIGSCMFGGSSSENSQDVTSQKLAQQEKNEKEIAADKAFRDTLLKTDRDDIWAKVDSFHDKNKFRALYQTLSTTREEIDKLSPESEKQKALQKALMDCYDKRIEYATDSIYAYDRTGEDRTASLIITKGDKEAADAAYQKFRDIADNL
ncbi:MAG: hypothetical protein MR665_02700 [Selenomonas bovis]|nr:hypothetical protein [Selenomonas bovis]MCI7056299.1 hypothetical protein [Selenomonas bovis]